jgi:hypothetical protein
VFRRRAANLGRFGAVVEAFEVKDALMKVLAAKDRSPRRDIVMSLPGMAR